LTGRVGQYRGEFSDVGQELNGAAMLSDVAQGSGFEVVVHFGAHKTATTFLQKFLKGAQRELWHHGVGYLPLDVCRESLLPFVAQSARGAEEAEKPDPSAMWRSIGEVKRSVDASGAKLRRLLISDENLAGPALAILNKRVLYPTAANRLRILVDQFPGARLKLMVCIRDYADFIPSVYCELLRRHKLAPLGKILGRNQNLFISWPSYISDIATALPECDVQYWCFEDFAGSPADAVEAMTGVRLVSIETAISRKVRPSLTRKAVAILQAARQHVTDDEHRRLAECLIDNMTFDGDSKLSIEDQSLADALRQRYRDDVAALQDISEPACGIVRSIKQ
jgi:hypothetical protein